MRYTLTHPMVITSRLMPGIKIGDATISIELADSDRFVGETSYAYYIDTPDGELYSAQDLYHPRTGDRGVREATRALLSLLSADAESYHRTMGESAPQDGWLFDAPTAEWAYLNAEEIESTMADLEAIRTYVKRPNTGDTLDTASYGLVTVTKVPDITGRTIMVTDAINREHVLTRAPNGHWTRVTVTASDRVAVTRVTK